ncbi:Ger(x)C family spore germination protein [Alteribacillus sp. HJP-4]|uniref:Ger(x)C family spore germination protein n=1 Tax=Alteribacillus sp. HJP-4 TaxID=2775394 RepID=UPI0035CD1210
MKKIITCFLLSLLIVTPGCVQPEIIDEVELIHALGYDWAGEDMVEGSVSIPLFQEEQELPMAKGSMAKSATITTTSHTSKDLRVELSARSPKTFNSSKLSVVMYNDELAERGIMRLVDTLRRDPVVGRRIYLCVVNGNVKQLLTTQSPLEDEVSSYLSSLIDQNIESQGLPTTNLHVFLYRYYGRGMDPYLPIIEKVNDQIELKGLAIMKEDKLVSTINLKDAFVFKMLVERFKRGMYEVNLGKHEFATIQNLQAHSTYKIKRGNQTPVISVNLDMKGFINEYSGEKLTPSKVKQIKKKVKREIQQNAEKLIKEFQEQEVDPIGFGDQVKTRTRQWDEKNWNEKYPDLDIQVTTNVQIVHSGVSD